MKNEYKFEAGSNVTDPATENRIANKRILYFVLLILILFGIRSLKAQNLSVSVSYICYNDTNGRVGYATAAVKGGTAPFTYKWSDSRTGNTDFAMLDGTYTVTVTDSNKNSATTTVTTKCSGTTGIRRGAKQMIAIDVYPNPANDIIIIDFEIEKNSMINLEIYNMIGAKIAELENEAKQAGTYKVKYNLEQLNAGIYFVKLSVDGKVSTTKIMITK